MKNLLLIGALVLLSACRTAKIATKDTASVAVQQQNNVAATATQSTTTAQATETKQAQVVEEATTTVNYDTSKPVVVQTGKPPVLQEITVKKISRIDANGKTTTQTAIQATQAITDKSQAAAKGTTKTEQKTTPVKPWIAYALYILVLLIALAASLLVYKYRQKIKSLFLLIVK